MITPDSMSKDAQRITDLYAQLERQMFILIIDKLKDKSLGDVDSSNVLQWKQHQLNQLNDVVNEAVKIVSGKNPQIEAELKHLIKENGQQIVSDIDNTLQKQTHKTVPVSQEVTDMIDSYLESAFTSFNKNINSTLLSRNVGDNATGKVYHDIINKATAQTITGLKTHEQAVNDAIYKWVEAGLPSALTNRAGNNIPIDSYARTVVNTSAHQAFNNLRLKRMEDYGTKLALMSSHAASRPACAPIQGQVVNLVPESDPRYDREYDSIYNHDYGKPGGVEGINCSHILFPYHKGWNTNNQPQYDPEEAIKNGEIQQKQRGYERNVRKYKKLLATAEKLKDTDGIQHYKGLIAGNQKRLRGLVKKHGFLYRDYSREKVYSSKPFTQKLNKTKLKPSVKDSDIINAFEKTNIKEAFGEEKYSQFKNSISSLKDEQLRKLYANYGQDLRFANVSSSNNSFARENEVHLSNSAFEGTKISEPMQTVYHEIGHAIDSTSMNDVYGKQLMPTGNQVKKRFGGKMYKIDELSGHLSGDPKINLGNTIKQDLFDYINHGEAKSPIQMGKKPRKKAEKAIWLEEDSKSLEGVEKIRQFVHDTKPTAWKNMRKYGDTSDIIEGTGYDLFDFPWGAGHGSKYWKNYGTAETEFFAEYTSARATNPASLALIKEIFPNAAKICDSLIDKMVEAKK